MCRSRAPATALARCSAPPGRMQPEGGARLPLVLIDYAHTPDALAKALRAARAHCRGRLWCVFGCGGDRDRGQARRDGADRRQRRRPAHRHRRQSAPRGSAADRRRRSCEGDHGRGRRWRRTRVIHDRALRHPQCARRPPRPGDVVLVAGKGHEDYQIVGTERRAFSDADGGARGAAPAGWRMIRTPGAVRRRLPRPPDRERPRIQ